jgi:hypothetical protein
MADKVEAVAIPARASSGDTVDSLSKLEAILTRCRSEDSVPIVHTVFGSKTGINEKFPTDFKREVE